MADSLLIHYNPSSAESSVWSVVNNEGELTTKLSTGNLGDAATVATNKKVILLLDSSYIHIDSVSLPTTNKQKLLHAAPFAIEEQLADEIEDLHFVVANTTNSEITAVACIRKETLDNILAECEAAKLNLDAILPDTLCLTANERQWSILFFNDAAYVHQQPLFGTVIERDFYKSLVAFKLENEETSTPEKIILFQIDDEEIEQLENKKLNETEIINVSYNQHPLVIFCGNYKQAMPLNLLQHDYKPVRKGNLQFKKWSAAASIAFIWLCVYLTNIAILGNNLEKTNNELRAKNISIYKQSFPKSKKIINARFQMEQKLKDLRAGGGKENDLDFLSILGSAHKAFSSNKDITIKNIDYRNNTMDISITSSNLKSVELINTKLNTNTLESTIISSTSENNIVKGNLRIKRPKS